MGISGCQAAKEASDMIILDDNFTSVFRAVQWGRNLFDNIRKFIQFQLTINLCIIYIVFISGASTGESPYNVIQLLWVNMIMDTLAALALGTEPPDYEHPHLHIVKKTDKIISPTMWRTILT